MSGPVLAALLAFLVIGGLATTWLLGLRLSQQQQATGIHALAGMHWREFQRLVVAVMGRRGYARTARSEQGASDALIELVHAGEVWLLSTKHGAGYAPGTAAIAELTSAVQLRGAAGGWMTTLGKLPADTVALARLQKIELLDGHILWKEINPLLEPGQRAEIMGAARARAMRHVYLAWALASAAALVVFLLGGRASGVQAPAAATSPPAAGSAVTTARAQATPAVESPAPDDPKLLAERRRKFATSVASLPWVDRALWSTRSTLVVHLSGAAEPDKTALCKLSEPYAELRASRLQLQPPHDSTHAVRFIQCRTY